jgi:hypothetical protein
MFSDAAEMMARFAHRSTRTARSNRGSSRVFPESPVEFPRSQGISSARPPFRARLEPDPTSPGGRIHGREVVRRGLAVIVLLVLAAAAAAWVGYVKSQPLDTHREDIKSIEVQPNPEGPRGRSSRDNPIRSSVPYPNHSRRSPSSFPTPSLIPSGRA